jgi:hypothetical protein
MQWRGPIVKLLYLDFGDPLDNAVGNTIPRLKKKYAARDRARSSLSRWWYGDSVVEKIDVYPCLAEVARFLSTPLGEQTGDLPEYKKVKARVTAFFLQHPDCKKIMVGMHGLVHDTTHGYALPSAAAPKISYLRVADMLQMLIGDYFKHTKLSLSLVMCYGARSAEYTKSHDPDRLGKVGGPDLSSSFAFKLFSLLCKNMKVKMSARTGALSFDDRSGASRVESEFTVATELALRSNPVTQEETALALQDEQAALAIEEFKNELQPVLDDRDWALNQRLEAQANAFAKSQVETLTGNDVLTRIKRGAAYSLFKQLPDAKPTKSGKITYEYDEVARKVVISCKYPAPKVIQRVSI